MLLCRMSGEDVEGRNVCRVCDVTGSSRDFYSNRTATRTTSDQNGKDKLEESRAKLDVRKIERKECSVRSQQFTFQQTALPWHSLLVSIPVV